MDRSRNFKVEKPGHIQGLETIDPEIFTELGQAYPQISNRRELWVKGEKRRNKNIPMLGILADVTKNMYEYVGEVTGVEPDFIEHSVRTLPIHSRRSQLELPGNWHADGKSDEERPFVFMATDALPTEFLIPGPRSGGIPMDEFVNKARVSGSFFQKEKIDIALELDMLSVFRPARYEGVITKGNIHRSPINHTGNLVYRTFFLLWVSSDQWLR